MPEVFRAMITAEEQINAQSAMQDILAVYPGAQRALFRKYHIGGCSSCAFRPDETLAQVCARNNNLNPADVLEFLKSSHEEDAKILISPRELAVLLQRDKSLPLLDVRSREEFEAVRIEGSLLMSQPTVQEIMGRWPRDRVFVIIDHDGRLGLDAAAYFAGHGFDHVRCLRGGIDAWSREINPALRRYKLA